MRDGSLNFPICSMNSRENSYAKVLQRKYLRVGVRSINALCCKGQEYLVPDKKDAMAY